MFPISKQYTPSPRAQTLSSVFKFLNENMALYLLNRLSFSSSNVFLSLVISVSCEGGAGSTEAYGLSDNFSDFAASINQFIRSNASSHVSATSTTES